MIELKIPLSETDVRQLHSGDAVSLSGLVVTARDAAHRFLIEERPDFIRPYLRDGAVYHCGPVVNHDDGGQWRFVSAGPTTSLRHEPMQAAIIGEYGLRAVIGKGGMAEKTLQALQRQGAVYLHAVGGAGSLIARHVTRVEAVFKLDEFGSPEALWVVRLDRLPLIVTMDSHGHSLHRQILDRSTPVARRLMSLD